MDRQRMLKDVSAVPEAALKARQTHSVVENATASLGASFVCVCIDARAGTLLCQILFDQTVRRVLSGAARATVDAMIEVWPRSRCELRACINCVRPGQPHQLLCQLRVDGSFAWHGRVFEVLCEQHEDLEVDVESLAYYLRRHTCLERFDDEMPWSAASAPYTDLLVPRMLESLFATYLEHCRRSPRAAQWLCCDAPYCCKPCCSGHRLAALLAAKM